MYFYLPKRSWCFQITPAFFLFLYCKVKYLISRILQYKVKHLNYKERILTPSPLTCKQDSSIWKVLPILPLIDTWIWCCDQPHHKFYTQHPCRCLDSQLLKLMPKRNLWYEFSIAFKNTLGIPFKGLPFKSFLTIKCSVPSECQLRPVASAVSIRTFRINPETALKWDFQWKYKNKPVEKSVSRSMSTYTVQNCC